MKTNKNVSLDELKAGYMHAAKIVTKHGDVYLPIFQRLHEELETKMAEEKLKNLALHVAQTME